MSVAAAGRVAEPTPDLGGALAALTGVNSALNSAEIGIPPAADLI